MSSDKIGRALFMSHEKVLGLRGHREKIYVINILVTGKGVFFDGYERWL